MLGRSLATSKFKVAYTAAEVPERPFELGGILMHPAYLRCQADLAKIEREKLRLRKKLKKQERMLAVPPYWRSTRLDSPLARHDNTRYMGPLIQQAMQDSIVGVGCACSAKVSNVRVTAVERVENMTLWRNYQTFKVSLQNRLRQSP